MRARSALRAERLNHARDVWAQIHVLPDAVRQLVQACGISPRQAYRDLQAARRLRAPVPIPEATIAFTVKLPRGMVRALRVEAATTGRSLSAIASRAIAAQLARSRGRG